VKVIRTGRMRLASPTLPTNMSIINTANSQSSFIAAFPKMVATREATLEHLATAPWLNQRQNFSPRQLFVKRRQPRFMAVGASGLVRNRLDANQKIFIRRRFFSPSQEIFTHRSYSL
jgi:hypothetical protein